MSNIDINTFYTDLNKDIEWLKTNSVFVTIFGSISHGLNTPESDTDYRGCAIPPKEYSLHFDKFFNEFIRKEPDITIFNLRKFFQLTSQGNPNTLEVLFTDPEYHIYKTDVGNILLEHREKFLSKQLKERYIGYAKSQAHRIKNHKRWIDNPRTTPPTREEFGLPKKPEIDPNQLKSVWAQIRSRLDTLNPDFEPFSEPQKIYLQNKVAKMLAEMNITIDNSWQAAARTLGVSENFIYIMQKEKEFDKQVEDYKSYLDWKQNRNPKRAALEEKHGYDTKHATALIRLLRMGKEILETGKVKVKRTDDREELMAIKNGIWTYEQVVEYADKIEDEVEASYKSSKLPMMPDLKFLNGLCMELIEMQWRKS